MIEVGKSYRLITLNLGSAGYERDEVSVTLTKVDGNLIELDGHRTLNMGSPLFHSLTDELAERGHFQKINSHFGGDDIGDDRDAPDGPGGRSDSTGY